MARSRKAFHFDLDTAKLKCLYPSDKENGWRNAWADVRSFMEKHGFEHAQYSGYESAQPMTYDKAYEIVESLNETYPWFRQCAQVASLTEIGKRHDVLQYLEQIEADITPEPEPAQERSTSLKEEAESMRRASRALSEDKSYDPPVKEERGEEI